MDNSAKKYLAIPLFVVSLFFLIAVPVESRAVQPKAAATPPKATPVPAAATNAAPAKAEVKPEVKAEDPFDKELRFVSGLVDWRLPDYAAKYLDLYLAEHPEMKSRASAIRVEILAGAGKFDEAQKMIAELPGSGVEAWKMKLALADKLYDWNKLNDARVIYDDFFKAYNSGPPPELREFYMEAAYKYGQMLLLKKEDEGAVRAYEYILLAKPEPDIEAKVQMDLAELCIKVAENRPADRDTYLKKAKDICDKILWKGVSEEVWRISVFGKALVVRAHIETIQGDTQAAIKLINDYLPMLKGLEDVLKQNKVSLSYSPMPECRYLLGTLSQEQGNAMFTAGKKDEGNKMLVSALGHFVNVYGKYPSSPWAIEAGQRANKIKDDLKGRGLSVTIPEFDMKPIIMGQLSDAQTLLSQNQFEEAAPKYLAVLNVTPEQELSVGALGDLIKCYTELKDTNYLYTVIDYLSERFSRNEHLQDAAGNLMIKTAEAAEARNDKELGDRVYNLYFSRFTKHARLPVVLYNFGETKLREKSYDQALSYFQQITNYPKAQLYLPSLNNMAYCYSMLNDYTNSLQIMSKYIAESPPSPGVLEARFRVADTYRRQDKLVQAINDYVQIEKILGSPAKASYMNGAEAEAKVRDIAERTLFWKALCLARLKEPADKVKSYQEGAIAAYNKFLVDFPKSSLAPKVLSRLGTLLQINGKPDMANRAFDRLAKEYSESMEAKEVVFVQATSLLELGQRDEALKVFKRMLDNDQSFSAPQFLRAAKYLYDAKDYDIALKCYQKAKANSQAREVWEPATLGVAQCSLEVGNAPDTVKAIEELFAKYPKSGYSVEAYFAAAKAYADVGSKETDPKAKLLMFNKAIDAMNKVRGLLARDAERMAQADIQLAQVYLLMGNKDAALATYVRMLMFGDWSNVKLKPYIEQAFGNGLPLILEKDRNEDAVSLCDSYLKTFPNGRWVNDARKWKGSAQAKLAASGGAKESGGAVAPVSDSVTAPPSGDQQTAPPAKAEDKQK